ncbi:MAG TPA: DUF885 family protein [Casimicrobiaceae bacterium]
MRNIRTPILLFAATLWLFAWATAGAQPASEKAHTLFDAYSEWQLRELPGYATAVGDQRYDDRLTDFSEAAIARRSAFVADLAKQLQGIDRNALVDHDRISYDVLAKVLDYDLRRFAVSRVSTWDVESRQRCANQDLTRDTWQEDIPPGKRSAER